MRKVIGEAADHLVRTHGWHFEYVRQGADDYMREVHEREHADGGCDWLWSDNHGPHRLAIPEGNDPSTDPVPVVNRQIIPGVSS